MRAGERDALAARDHVDEILAQWERERPGLDTSPIAVIGRVSRLSRILDSDIEALYAEHGPQGGRFSVLVALRRSGPPFTLSPTELYRSLLVSSGAMTKRLEHLESLGLIRRERGVEDRRYEMVVLTEEGAEVADRVFDAHLENERELLRALEPERQALLAELLRDVLVSLGDGPRGRDETTLPARLSVERAGAAVRALRGGDLGQVRS